MIVFTMNFDALGEKRPKLQAVFTPAFLPLRDHGQTQLPPLNWAKGTESLLENVLKNCWLDKGT